MISRPPGIPGAHGANSGGSGNVSTAADVAGPAFFPQPASKIAVAITATTPVNRFFMRIDGTFEITF
jgi:hypothetical protein